MKRALITLLLLYGSVFLAWKKPDIIRFVWILKNKTLTLRLIHVKFCYVVRMDRWRKEIILFSLLVLFT